jgi:hypothetical protein
MFLRVFVSAVLAFASAFLGSQLVCQALSGKQKESQVTPDICFSKVGDFVCRGDLYTPAIDMAD